MPIDPNIYWRHAQAMPQDKYTRPLNAFNQQYDLGRQRQMQDVAREQQRQQFEQTQERNALAIRRTKEDNRNNALARMAYTHRGPEAAGQFDAPWTKDQLAIKKSMQPAQQKQQIVNDQVVSFGAGQPARATDITGLKQPQTELSQEIRDRQFIFKGETLQESYNKVNEQSNIPEPDKIFNMEKDLRKEYQAESKDYKKVRDAYTRIVESAKDPSPAGDLALIFNYMKVLDPGSVVRESEFRTAENAKSALERAKESGETVPNFIWGAVNKLMTGQRMLEIQRKDFVGRAEMLYSGMERQHKKRTEQYKGVAQRNKLEIRNIILDILPAELESGSSDPLNLGF